VAPSLSRIVSVLAGATFYFALAVWGWGGTGPYFSHPALAGLAVAFFAMSVASLFCGGNLSPGIREDRGNRWVLPAFGVLGLTNAYLPAWSDRVEFWTLDGDALRWFGVGLFVFSGWLRLWPVVVLEDRFSGLVAIQPGHRLATAGVYKNLRNPSYLGLLLNSRGWPQPRPNAARPVSIFPSIPICRRRLSKRHPPLITPRSFPGGRHDRFLLRAQSRAAPGSARASLAPAQIADFPAGI
jgi:protein-S-isoprenylcysteine O-methyltransferase Ste14